MDTLDYWKECVACAADECGLVMTEEQLVVVARDVEAGHDNYGMAFYSPPPSDRRAVIEREHKEAMDRLKREYDQYRSNAEVAIKRALRVHRDDMVSIGDDGEVRRIGGRFDRIL